MRLTINLATRTIYDRGLVNLILAGIITILVILLAWNIIRISLNQGELRRLGADIATSEKKLNIGPASVPEKEYAGILANIKFYNGIIEQRAFGWLSMLDQLEAATPEGIAVSTLTLDKKSGTVKIEGLAHDFRKVQAYLDKLVDSGYFADVQLLSNKNKTLWEQAKGVEFSLSFRVRAS